MPKIASLLTPASVAVVGASERPGPGRHVLVNLLDADFLGQVFAVNPRYEAVLGVACYPDLSSIAEVPETVVLAIPARYVPDALSEAGRLGVRAAVILSSGFAEVGGNGADLQADIQRIAHEYDIAVSGPNCMGLINYGENIPLFSGVVPPAVTVEASAVVAQSGSVSVALLNGHGPKPTYLLSVGNQAGVDSADFLAYFAADSKVRSMGFFLETIPRAGEFFIQAARAAQLGKPTIVCQTGKSARGAEATSAHTGALAQPYSTFTNLAEQFGVIVVDDLDTLSQTISLTSAIEHHGSSGVGLVNVSGGQNALILDLAADMGLEFTALSPQTRDRLQTILPEYGMADNPLDVTGTVMADADGYRGSLEAMAEDPGVGVIAAVVPLPNIAVPEGGRYRFWHMLESIAAVGESSGKPIVVLTAIPGPLDSRMTSFLSARNIPLLHGFKPGLAAIAHYVRWKAGRAQPVSPNLLCSSALPNANGQASDQLRRLVADNKSDGLSEADAKRIMTECGFPTPQEVIAHSAHEAVVAAERIGFPVAMKIDSPDIAHKSEVGGIRLGCGDPDAVARAYEEMKAEVAQKAPEARITGVLVAEQVSSITEALVGMKYDADLGPLILFGMGGIHAEIFNSYFIRKPPIDPSDVRSLITRLRGHEVFFGARGRPNADVEALVDFICRFGEFCLDNAGLLTEIDLNPIAVLAEGEGVRMLDALFIPKTVSN